MKMKMFSLALLALMVLPTFAVIAEEVTLEGEPVEMQCFLSGRSGEGHATCAKSCVEGGQPIGFLAYTDDGDEELYLVLGADKKPAKEFMLEHMGKDVAATGTVTKKDGMRILTVSKVEGLADEDDWLPTEVVGSGSIQNQ